MNTLDNVVKPAHLSQGNDKIYSVTAYHAILFTIHDRFEYWLKQAYPNLSVKVVNFGIPATNSQSIISYLGEEFYNGNFDLVYVSIYE